MLSDLQLVDFQFSTEPAVFERGKAYWERRRVLEVMQRGEQLFALVEGSDFKPYQVVLDARDDPPEAYCSCPYDWGRWCKHIVAVGLTLLHSPERIQRRAPLVELLKPLDANSLRALVMALAENDFDVQNRIDDFLDGRG